MCIVLEKIISNATGQGGRSTCLYLSNWLGERPWHCTVSLNVVNH